MVAYDEVEGFENLTLGGTDGRTEKENIENIWRVEYAGFSYQFEVLSGEAKDTEKEEGVKNYFWCSNVGNGNSFRDRTNRMKRRLADVDGCW